MQFAGFKPSIPHSRVRIVLGKKKSAIGVGHPGQSRKRAYEQREQTLGVEYERVGKVNKIVDRRIGEKNKNITTEEKASLRFTAERVKHLKKGSKFNLTDDNDEGEELLTHGGRALTDIQKYDKLIGSDDDDDDPGTIGADVVKAAHFGGGDLDASKKPEEKLSRKDVIAELIAKTRHAREEKHVAKDEMETATEELDAKYHKLLDRVKNVFRPPGTSKAERSEKDDYDKLKLPGSCKTKEANQTQKECSLTARKSPQGHRSIDADCLDETQKKKPKKQGFEVRFSSDGQLLNADKIEPVTKKKVAIDSDEELTDEELEDENEEELDDLIGEFIDLAFYPYSLTLRNHSQLDKPIFLLSADDDLEVPFVFEMPKKYEQLVDLLTKYRPQKTDVVLQRLIKCYHPSLAEGNKKLLSKLFLYLLRFYDETSNSPVSSDSLVILGSLTKSLYFDVEFSVRCVRALIRQNWKKRMSKPKLPTSFSTVTLIAALFPVSDNWHPVCSPAMALAAVTLAKGRVSSLSILARQILLATVVSDFSFRYVPEAIAFCQGALLMAVENEESESPPTTAFPVSLPHRRMLYITEVRSCAGPIACCKGSKAYFYRSLEANDVTRCRVLRALVAVVQKYRILYAAHEHTFAATFSPFVALLKRLPVSRLPSVLAEEVEALTCSMEAECKLRSKLTQMSRVVTEKSMMKMLEPRFEENFDPERPRLSPHAEKEKLRHMVKKETRGAIKELRKDATFLMRKQRKEVAAKDRDRREKMKRLMGGLQSQQGEWNKELRESGKKDKRK
ncbi:unnamed protein product [Heligmosomoides polygyrus]|uniref:Nucleolar protein 14 n=1 Tax=Heligmosomoides polygyrus TaxID=6339 RepID=A0A3P8BA91_HELPZ|nr:unnamed protein product [Heligmosomoides polygyrus]